MTARTLAVVRSAAFSPAWRTDDAEAIWQMRQRMEDKVTPGSLKRGTGGLVDIEFLVQMLQLKHASAHPEVAVPGTLNALAALAKAGVLRAKTAISSLPATASCARFNRGCV